MPRCLMAKKWKGYAWADRVADDKPARAPAEASAAAASAAEDDDEEDEEEIDVVGDTAAVVAAAASCWAPSSPTAGATAPSPPPPHHVDARVAVLYNGCLQDFASYSCLNAYFAGKSRTPDGHFDTSSFPQPPPPAPPSQRSYAVLQTPSEARQYVFNEVPSWEAPPPPPPPVLLPPPPPRPLKKSLAMCFTSTGAALSLPPKKKDIYRPYSLDDTCTPVVKEEAVRRPAAEDLRAAHAILDLSAATHGVAPAKVELGEAVMERDLCPMSPTLVGSHDGKTVAYTYEAFFVSDGRSKRKSPSKNPAVLSPPSSPLSPAPSSNGSDSSRPRYTCPECGKQYATSSNLSRHKQTHRSLDSQSAKKCLTCGKAYVSMPALAMHLLTHKLSHACGVCGKLFSRPWLLQGHLRSHSGEKPFGCAHCGKAFADRSNLRAHMQTHSADKNYACARCHKSFALKSYLNKHLESACFKDGGCSGVPEGGERAASCPPPAVASFHEARPITPYN